MSLAKPLPLAEYRKLSPQAKASLKAFVSGQGAYKVKGRGAYKAATPRKVVRKSQPVTRVGGRGAYKIDDDKVSGRDLAKAVASKGVGWIWDSLFGNGDYAPNAMNPFKVGHNSLMKEITANGPPAVWTTNDRSFVFRHREYIGDILSSSVAGQFELQSFAIQPGNATTFPWLSNIARNFQQYNVKGMLFEFVSTSGDALNSTNTALGQVLMCTNYNSAEEEFTSKQQMLQTEFCSNTKPSCSMLHPIECKPSLTTIENLYVREGAVPSDQDIRLYDLGNFQIATVGCQGTSVNLGELHVTYEIEFLKPIQTPGPGGFLSDFWSSSSGVTVAAPFGTSPALSSGSNGGTTISSQTVTFDEANPGDQWLVVYQQTGSARAVGGYVSPTLTATRCTKQQFWQNYGVTAGAAPTNADTTTQLAMWATVLKMDASFSSAPTLAVVYGANTTLDAPSRMDMLITKISPAMLPQLAEIFEEKEEVVGEVKQDGPEDAVGIRIPNFESVPTPNPDCNSKPATPSWNEPPKTYSSQQQSAIEKTLAEQKRGVVRK